MFVPFLFSLFLIVWIFCFSNHFRWRSLRRNPVSFLVFPAIKGTFSNWITPTEDRGAFCVFCHTQHYQAVDDTNVTLCYEYANIECLYFEHLNARPQVKEIDHLHTFVSPFISNFNHLTLIFRLFSLVFAFKFCFNSRYVHEVMQKYMIRKTWKNAILKMKELWIKHEMLFVNIK